MNLDLNLSSALILSIIAIIIALIAVGVSLRRTIATPGAAASNHSDKRNHAMLGFRKLLLSDPSYVAIWRKGQEGVSLDSEHKIVYNQLLFEYWHAQQEGYLRALEGDDQWSIERARETVLADHDRLPEALNRLRVGHMLHPDYDKFLNQMIEEIQELSTGEPGSRR